MKVGILGAGQLAMMMAQAGQKLGLEFMFLCPDSDSCAAPYGQLLCASYDDIDAREKLATWADVITYEFENVSLPLVKYLESKKPVHPNSMALQSASDRWVEKSLFRDLGILTAEFAKVNSLEDLQKVMSKFSYPAILKTRTQGYDGKGQVVLKDQSQLSQAWHQVKGVPCIVESMVPFEKELSVIAVRSQEGEVVCYPVSENFHREGILRLSICSGKHELQKDAEKIVSLALNKLDYVGVLAVELFLVDGKFLVNEMAPRVHNTGHWSIEVCASSQFENHLRAVCHQAIGDVTVKNKTAMVNLIGLLPDIEKVNEIAGAYPHYYNKAVKPGRKVGHITLMQGDRTDQEFMDSLEKLLSLAGENPRAYF